MIVKKEMCLLDFLLQSYNRKNAKNLLKYQQVYVNSKPIARFDHPLKVNDVVEIKKKETTPLDIIYEDQDLIVINKPSGLLSMSDGKEKETNIEALKFGIREMINEGIDIENENQEVKRDFLTSKQVGRIITNLGLKEMTKKVHKVVIDSTKTEEEQKNA